MFSQPKPVLTRRPDDGDSKHLRNVVHFLTVHGATSQKAAIFKQPVCRNENRELVSDGVKCHVDLHDN
jgi:hypothetical protein